MRTFGHTPIAAEIGGNQYHLPDSLTKALRIRAAKEITAYEKAVAAATDAGRRLQVAGKDADERGAGALDEKFTAAEKEFREADGKVADCARYVLVKLLDPVQKDGTVPTDIGEHVADVAALEYVDTLLDRRRVEPDPQ